MPWMWLGGQGKGRCRQWTLGSRGPLEQYEMGFRLGLVYVGLISKAPLSPEILGSSIWGSRVQEGWVFRSSCSGSCRWPKEV